MVRRQLDGLRAERLRQGLTLTYRTAPRRESRPTDRRDLDGHRPGQYPLIRHARSFSPEGTPVIYRGEVPAGPDAVTPIGQSVQALDTPTVLVDLDVLERNVARMAAFAAEHNIALRPHAKSHKTLGIAERQRSAGAAGFTVAKLDEAEAYLAAGFDDLLIANEIVGVDKWQRLAAMQRRNLQVAEITLQLVGGEIRV